MIIFDASVIIAHLNAADAHHDVAKRILLDSAQGSRGASPITLAEVLVGPAKASAVDTGHSMLTHLGFEQIPLGPDAPIRLATLRTDTGLKLPGCCVLLAAEQSAAAAIATFDDRLAAVARRAGCSECKRRLGEHDKGVC